MIAKCPEKPDGFALALTPQQIEILRLLAAGQPVTKFPHWLNQVGYLKKKGMTTYTVMDGDQITERGRLSLQLVDSLVAK